MSNLSFTPGALGAPAGVIDNHAQPGCTRAGLQLIFDQTSAATPAQAGVSGDYSTLMLAGAPSAQNPHGNSALIERPVRSTIGSRSNKLPRTKSEYPSS